MISIEDSTPRPAITIESVAGQPAAPVAVVVEQTAPVKHTSSSPDADGLSMIGIFLVVCLFLVWKMISSDSIVGAFAGLMFAKGAIAVACVLVLMVV